MRVPWTSHPLILPIRLDGIRSDATFILPPSDANDARLRQRLDAVLKRRNPEPPRW